MCKINQAKNTNNEEINKLRAASVHRAMWMGLILKEAKDKGLDWETIGREAIRKTGCIHGDGIKERMDVPGSLVSFGNTFFNQDIKDIFEIEVKKITEDALELEYGHCPLVTGWMSLGFEGEFLEKLCDIAMCGDRGIESRFDDFEFKLGKTIAEGNKVCEVSFYRKK